MVMSPKQVANHSSPLEPEVELLSSQITSQLDKAAEYAKVRRSQLANDGLQMLV